MKIETAKVVSQAKMVKSDLWISKNKVSAMFKIIFEKSFTQHCITEGFRKCGIFPYDPNAIDKSLLLRSNADIDPSTIDLSVKSVQPVAKEASPGSTTNQVASDINSSDNDLVLDSSFSWLQGNDTEPIFDVSFSVGEDGILTLEQSSGNSEAGAENMSSTPDEGQDCPPELAFSAVELSLTPRKKRRFEECFDLNIELNNPLYKTWYHLKNKVRAIIT
jgi:hypothetical protein